MASRSEAFAGIGKKTGHAGETVRRYMSPGRVRYGRLLHEELLFRIADEALAERAKTTSGTGTALPGPIEQLFVSLNPGEGQAMAKGPWKKVAALHGWVREIARTSAVGLPIGSISSVCSIGDDAILVAGQRGV